MDLPPRPEPRHPFRLTLDDDTVEHFHEHGYASVPRITSDEEVEWLRVVFDAFFAERRGAIPGGYFDLARPYDADGADDLPQVLVPEVQVPELRRTDFWANARRATAQLLGCPPEELQGWGHMIRKPARHGGELPWHQDESYWDPGFDYRAVGNWLPLDDVDERNGCMTFVPGSHRSDVLHHRHIDDDPSVHGLWTDEITDEQVAAAVAVPLRAGGATFHHPRTLHRTGPNTTDRPRRAYANEFQATPVEREVRTHRPWVDEGQARWNERSVIASATRGTRRRGSAAAARSRSGG